MPLQLSNVPVYKVYTATSAASITAGFTTSVCSPMRGKVTNVYLGAIDGTAIGGSNALLSLTIAGTASGSVSLPPAAAGRASTGEMLGPVSYVNEGEIIKLALATGLTNAAAGVVTLIVRMG